MRRTTRFTLQASPEPVHRAVTCSKVCCLSGSYSTERSWQDFDFSQNATLGLFLATTLSRKRLAFIGRLSLRVLQWMCLRRLLASLESRRRRSCRTMPWKASQTLCCMAAEVSINLQSNTAAQARPSETWSQWSGCAYRKETLNEQWGWENIDPLILYITILCSCFF